VRGTGCRPSSNHGHSRFIPARAGNGTRPPAPPAPMTVHPRTCGERVPCSFSITNNAGSSPHVRGTEVQVLHQHCHRRFIPARAGNGGSP